MPKYVDRFRIRMQGLPRGPREAKRSLGLLGDLRRRGWHESRSGPVVEGETVPWLTYPAIYWLGTVISGDEVVFEYGAGNSTLWWASHVARVISVEHNRGWYERVGSNAPKNAEILLRDEAHYVSAIEGRGPFDIVLIDGGPSRQSSLKAALKEVTPTGLFILDDTDLESYSAAATELQRQGMLRLDFVGPRPGTPFLSMTSVLSRDMNRWCSKINHAPFRAWYEDVT